MTARSPRIPQRYGFDIPPSDHQAMVEEEYNCVFSPLSNSQAIALHNWFMYAKAVVVREHVRSPYARRRALTRAAAVFISEDQQLAQQVQAIMESRFKRGSRGDLSRTVQNTEPFGKVSQFLGAFVAP